MIDTQPLFDDIGIDRDLIVNFFVIFSRFEYALKQSGYVRGTDTAQPDWDTLARDLGPFFDANYTVELHDAVDYLMTDPPNKQATANGQLMWIAQNRPPNEPVLLSLLCYTRRIRNNLFHGGKFAPHR